MTPQQTYPFQRSDLYRLAALIFVAFKLLEDPSWIAYLKDQAFTNARHAAQFGYPDNADLFYQAALIGQFLLAGLLALSLVRGALRVVTGLLGSLRRASAPTHAQPDSAIDGTRSSAQQSGPRSYRFELPRRPSVSITKRETDRREPATQYKHTTLPRPQVVSAHGSTGEGWLARVLFLAAAALMAVYLLAR